VWTTGENSEPKPVLVFIHGGSNTGGWSYEPNYRGHALAERGVVVVTVAYRLGVFGWLSHPDMAIRNPGLHDLIVALDWVNTNIGAFGGDPNRIVVSGESAGADNALHLALAPAMVGKLAGVIHQSAGWSVTSTLKPEDGFALGEALVAYHLGADGTFADLKGISAAELLDSQLDVFSGHYFSPIPDPETLPVSLEQTVASDSLPVLNLLIGSNRNESLMYIPDGAVLTCQSSHKWIDCDRLFNTPVRVLRWPKPLRKPGVLLTFIDLTEFVKVLMPLVRTTAQSCLTSLIPMTRGCLPARLILRSPMRWSTIGWRF
jgi:para-nitrobenzyl esterase